MSRVRGFPHTRRMPVTAAVVVLEAAMSNTLGALSPEIPFEIKVDCVGRVTHAGARISVVVPDTVWSQPRIVAYGVPSSTAASA